MLFIPDKVRRRLLSERDRQSGFSAVVKDRIKAAGLRPTKQRIALGEILFRDHQGHTTAEQLHRQSIKSGVRLSLATVYNTLNQFADAGLLSKVNLDGEQSYFDINISDHHHFYIETQNLLIDIPADELTFGKLPSPPKGYRISKIDVLIGLEPVSAKGCPGQLSSDCAACSGCCSSPKLHLLNEKGPRP
ncbi:iron response transcriptional regulator IrrA [Phyllobacterium sp. P30BS-XVII]|uniref:iron response transcriptional regulator IrrA n=1 Tax=Phyllobacterium sp. P30BS-XVII TaxID=2587046 RepID=UPI0015F955F3|nr:Fur family transcriptional regulator [Phyllobacterium sp. P30BS-XVII]MBA8901359.1 Fur family iron response transcriptional regulator [Phyllobacterium sp. P30BS-XVII]